jgi:hypothetical protein
MSQPLVRSNLTVLDLPASERPRERLVRLGAVALPDQELVCCLLGRGIRGQSVLVTAQRLLKGFCTLRGVAVDVDDVGRWWNRTGEEIDVVAPGPREILAGEVTWSGRPADARIVRETLRKIGLLERTDGRPVRPLVAARAGLAPEARAEAEEVHALVPLEDVARAHDVWSAG